MAQLLTTGTSNAKKPSQKINVLDTTALQYPLQYILPKVEKRRNITVTEDDEDPSQ